MSNSRTIYRKTVVQRLPVHHIKKPNGSSLEPAQDIWRWCWNIQVWLWLWEMPRREGPGKRRPESDELNFRFWTACPFSFPSLDKPWHIFKSHMATKAFHTRCRMWSRIFWSSYLFRMPPSASWTMASNLRGIFVEFCRFLRIFVGFDLISLRMEKTKRKLGKRPIDEPVAPPPSFRAKCPQSRPSWWSKCGCGDLNSAPFQMADVKTRRLPKMFWNNHHPKSVNLNIPRMLWNQFFNVYVYHSWFWARRVKQTSSTWWHCGSAVGQKKVISITVSAKTSRKSLRLFLNEFVAKSFAVPVDAREPPVFQEEPLIEAEPSTIVCCLTTWHFHPRKNLLTSQIYCKV